MALVTSNEKVCYASTKISYIQLSDDVFIYNSKVTLGGDNGSAERLVEMKYGLCFKSELDAFLENPSLDPSSFALNKYFLFKESFKTAVVTDRVYDLGEYICDFKKIFNGDEEVPEKWVVLKPNLGSNDFYEYGKDVPIPRAVYFSCNHFINERFYNLDQITDALLKRTDVTKNRNESDFVVDASEQHCTRHVAFTWHPTQEDWERCFIINKHSSTSIADVAIKEVFGFKKII